jgi:hypothetical protein
MMYYVFIAFEDSLAVLRVQDSNLSRSAMSFSVLRSRKKNGSAVVSKPLGIVPRKEAACRCKDLQK